MKIIRNFITTLNSFCEETTNETTTVSTNACYKVLLLGCGHVGKSTIYKQLKVIYGNGFGQDDATSASKHIQDSIIVQMKNLLMLFKNPENDQFKDDLINSAGKELIESARKISNLSPEQPLSSVADDIAKLWQNEMIKNAYRNRTNLSLCDSAAAFFDDIERFQSPSYIATQQDIILSYIPTTGCVFMCFCNSFILSRNLQEFVI